MLKVCKRCGQEKPISEYGLNNQNKDGHQTKCKICVAELQRAYANSPERKARDLELHKQYRERNHEKELERYRKYGRENRDKCREKNKAWLAKNPGWAAEWMRKYRAENPEKFAGYEEKRKPISAQRRKDWRDRNVEKANAYNRKFLKDNPEKMRAYGLKNHRKRRAQKAISGTEHFTQAEFLELCEKYGNKCLRCGRDDVKLCADHVIPLDLGGSDGIENIQPLCRPCNSWKKNRHADFRQVWPVQIANSSEKESNDELQT